MNQEIKNLINQAVFNMIKKSGDIKKIEKIDKKHDVKIHFIPQKYRIFGGILQSMNIQFGNFIEELMRLIIEQDNRYEILELYSGKKSNTFKLSQSNEARIDRYITDCQLSKISIIEDFKNLLSEIINDNDKNLNNFKHDIDLLYKDKITNIIYYLEIKFNDDHDTGKFIDINRKFIKTYAYLVKELEINSVDNLVPILFFFTNKKMKGNIYVPEETNIYRGRAFFEKFLQITYESVDEYMNNLSESKEVVEMFDNLYHQVMNY